MNKYQLKCAPALLVALSTISSANAGIGGSAPTDYQQFKVSGPGTLAADTGNATSLATILDGSATPAASGAPGGNVELFTSSDSMTNATFANYHGTTTLTGNLGSSTLTLSSLNTDDWSTVVSPGKTLLQSWVSDLLAVNGLTPTVPQQDIIQNLFVSNGGMQRFSDPNIAYAYTESGNIHVGLAGFADAKPLLQGAVASLLLSDPTNLTYQTISSTLAGLTAVPISELVKVSYNGLTEYLYGFTSIESGLVSNDSTESFTSVFDLGINDPINSGSQRIDLLVDAVSVPEPSSIFVMILGLFSLMISRKKQA